MMHFPIGIRPWPCPGCETVPVPYRIVVDVPATQSEILFPSLTPLPRRPHVQLDLEGLLSMTGTTSVRTFEKKCLSSRKTIPNLSIALSSSTHKRHDVGDIVNSSCAFQSKLLRGCIVSADEYARHNGQTRLSETFQAR